MKFGRAHTAKGVLRGAKRILQTKGWVQYADMQLNGGQPSFCARGALLAAAGVPFKACDCDDNGAAHYMIDWKLAAKNPGYVEAKRLADLASEEIAAEQPDLHEVFCDVVDMNDYTGRTLEEVLHVFDRALVLADRKQQDAA